jgi:Holliday junction resolvase
MRRASKIDANQPDIVAALRAAGADVMSIAQIGGGYPDIIVGYRGANYMMEIKPSASAKLRKGQDYFRLWWRGQVCRVNSPEEALKAIGL